MTTQRGSTAKGWVLCHVSGKGQQVVNRRYGPFTSVRHVLQQRAVKLPDEVRLELAALDEAAGSGDEALGEMPGQGLPPSG